MRQDNIILQKEEKYHPVVIVAIQGWLESCQEIEKVL